MLHQKKSTKLDERKTVLESSEVYKNFVDQVLKNCHFQVLKMAEKNYK